MQITQPISTKFRSTLYTILTGFLLGALSFHLSWAKGQTMDALRFIVIVIGVVFILRNMIPKINWAAIAGFVFGVVLVVVCPNLSLSSLGTEQLVLVLGIFLLMR